MSTQHLRPLSQVEIEAAIMAVVAEMETLTEEYAGISDDEAEAENAYKRRKFRAVITLSERSTLADGRKPTVDWREAQAETIAADEADTYRLAQARLRSTKEALLTKRARLDALRSLAANVRGQGG